MVLNLSKLEGASDTLDVIGSLSTTFLIKVISSLGPSVIRFSPEDETKLVIKPNL
jgi:hypothetical protein